MGGKPRPPRAKATADAPEEPTAEQWRLVVAELAGCVMFAITYLEPPGGGDAVRVQTQSGKVVMAPWEETFMKALDLCGLEVDRAAYYAEREERSGRPRRMAS